MSGLTLSRITFDEDIEKQIYIRPPCDSIHPHTAPLAVRPEFYAGVLTARSLALVA